MSPAGARARALLEAALESGERLAWSGRPDPARLIAVERKWLPGGVACIALAAWIAWRASADLLAILSAAFGLNAATLPSRAAKAADGILYALTDRRAIIVDLRRLDPLQQWPLAALKLQVRQAPGADRGDLTLRRRDFFPAALEGFVRQRRPVFFAIEYPEKVSKIAREQASRYSADI